MTVGVMIGSGIFLLPAVLAPFGSISFLGWLFTAAGAIVVALVLGRLASRTTRSGGMYVYAREAFGEVPGFIVAWSYWLSLLFGVAAISVAFAGYLGAIVPGLASKPVLQATAASAILWLLTLINTRSVSAAATAQLFMTVLKIIPLLVVIGLGLWSGSASNIPRFNPQGLDTMEALAATALLTMWAFVGLEAGVVPAGEVRDPTRTVPRAVVIGTLCVALLYISATAAVMTLVPATQLAISEAPFADAAQRLGALGAPLIALGALVSTAGSLNGNILLSGQIPLAVAQDGLAPSLLLRTNRRKAPVFALLLSSSLATLVLLLNYSGGLVAAFTFLISMSTLAVLFPYVVTAAAELRLSLRQPTGWALLALVALVYSIIAILGAGIEALSWGALLVGAGVPVGYGFRRVVRRQVR